MDSQNSESNCESSHWQQKYLSAYLGNYIILLSENDVSAFSF